MLEVNVHQQIKSDVSIESKTLLLIPSTRLNCQIQPAFHLLPATSIIQKIEPVIYDNSMFNSDMEFFVNPASGFAIFRNGNSFRLESEAESDPVSFASFDLFQSVTW